MAVLELSTASASHEDFLIQHTTKELEEEVLGKSASITGVEWKRSQDAAGQPLFTLRLTDLEGTATAEDVFTLEELEEGSDLLSARLYHLWGLVLQIQSHQILARLRSLGDD